MAIAKSRVLYDNVITDDATFTVSSLRDGIVSAPIKDGTGSARMIASGVYSGSTDLEYTVEIDSVAGGAEVGQSTFRWKDGGTSWDATGVTAASTATTLNNGVNVKFVSGTGDDFDLGDIWYFKAVNRFAPKKMLDNLRYTSYRSDALESPNTITIDLGEAKSFNSFVLYDHNLTAGATITFEANSSDSWGAPPVSVSISHNPSKILHYFSQTYSYRYVRISMADTSNADGYIDIGGMWLGSYLELSRTYQVGHDRSIRHTITSVSNRYEVTNRTFHGKRQTFNGLFTYLTDTDYNNLVSMMDVVANASTEKIIPVYFNLDANDTDEFYLMEIEGLNNEVAHVDSSGNLFHNVRFDMIEVAKPS